MIKEILKLAKLESEWIKYYGFKDSRKNEKFEDINFYDRIVPIGYSKVYTTLEIRCPMGYVNSLDKITDSCYGPRNHKKNIYTNLEYVIHNKIEGYLDLIKLIKD